MAALPDTYVGAIRPADGPEIKLSRLPLPEPGQGEVLIRNVAAASNPKDWIYPLMENNFSYVQGSDSAGVVVKLGPGAAEHGIELDMRVAAFTRMNDQNSKYGGYAEYTVAPACTTFILPENTSFEAGSSLPLCMLTAYVGLFVDLAIPPPPSFAEPFADATRAKEAVIVYGASSSAGSYAVQLAKRAGYSVIGVAGSSSDYARSLGADDIIDYRGKSDIELEQALVQALQSRLLTANAAFDCNAEGSSSVILANVLFQVPTPSKRLMVSRLLKGELGLFEKFPFGVGVVWTYVDTAYGRNAEACEAFAREVTQALVQSTSNASPLQPNRVKIMPKGLESVGEGLELLKKGKIHGEKLVYRVADTPGM